MNKREQITDIRNKRLLSWQEAQDYCGMGRAAVRDYGERIGAIKRYGRRVLFDRNIIDAKLTEDTVLK